MNKQWLDGTWDHIRQSYGVYMRVLDAIPADRFDTHPVAGMRTPTRMVVHTSGSIVRDIAEGIASGQIKADEAGEEAVASGLGSKEVVLDFARACWERADAAIGKSGDAQLAGAVGNPWGMPLNGTVALQILNDEFLHHRGQLYTFVRACGGTPPFLWSFGENAHEFQPRK